MIDLKKLYIEPTSDCNLQCQMCFRHTWFDETYCEMTWEIFDRVMTTLPASLETIILGGMGEPLHHPRILEMVEACKSKGCRVEMLTNGTLLTDDTAQSLMDLGLDRLWISMDDIEPGDGDGLGHPMYDHIVDCMKAFNRKRLLQRHPIELGITFVATKDNVHQLANLPWFIDRYHINEVNISNMYPSDLKAQEATLYQRTVDMSTGSDVFGSKRPVVNIPYMDFDLPEVRQGMGGMLSKMNFNMHIANTPVPRRSQHCRFVHEGMTFVRSDGNVSPCMALLHNGTTVIAQTERKVHHHSFGNMADEGLETIWESKAYRDFRQRVHDFEFSPCMTCGHCDYPEANEEDCFGNEKPTCGACLWAEGLLSCP